jgi:quercetin dioxygenase-like cupin family protein
LATNKATLHRWEEVPSEEVADGISRRYISGDRAMLAHLHLQKGAIVPKHSHENEQITYIVQGALRFWIGEEGADIFDVRGGEVLHIPSNIPHRVEALEDTINIDVFSPPRQDWIEKTDDYFRRRE